MLKTLEELIQLCQSKTRIFIYGAGVNGTRLASFLQDRNIIINGFIVSDMEDNPEKQLGFTVISVVDFQKKEIIGFNGLILVSIGKMSSAYRSVFETIIKYQLKNVVFVPDEILKIIKKEEIDKQKIERGKEIERLLTRGSYYLAKYIPVEQDHVVLALSDQQGIEYHWRLRDRLAETGIDFDILTWFSQKTALEEFQEQYGKYYVLHSLEKNGLSKETSCAIYMAHTHRDEKTTQIFLSPWIIPIQVGAALTKQQISQICDNQGDNISERNGIYSECTALYWIWKHAQRTDYIGLCHYRRHFDISEEDLLGMSENGIDVLVTAPTFIYEGIGDFFASLTPKTDIEMMLKAIMQVQPEYFKTAKAFLEARFFPPCNLSLMKYDLFQEYAEFVFSITFQIEEFYDNMGFYRKDRYMGYLVECLLGIFLMYNKEQLKIAYTDMRFYS